MLHFKYLYDLWGCQFWELQFFESSFGNLRVCYTGKSTISVSFSGWPAGNLQSHGICFQGRSVNLFNSFPCFIIMASFCWYQVLVTPTRCVQKQQLCYMWMCPISVLWNCIWLLALTSESQTKNPILTCFVQILIFSGSGKSRFKQFKQHLNIFQYSLFSFVQQKILGMNS